VLGAAGGIGQPLALLLKGSALIGELSLYDVANTAGVAADLGHISTACRVRAYTGPAQLQDALRGCQLVVIPAGAPPSPYARPRMNKRLPNGHHLTAHRHTCNGSTTVVHRGQQCDTAACCTAAATQLQQQLQLLCNQVVRVLCAQLNVTECHS
jgi:lactate/malate dehydrogenase, NAD binding domain